MQKTKTKPEKSGSFCLRLTQPAACDVMSANIPAVFVTTQSALPSEFIDLPASPPLSISLSSYFHDVTLLQALCVFLLYSVRMWTLTEHLLVPTQNCTSARLLQFMWTLTEHLLISTQNCTSARLLQFKAPNSNSTEPALVLCVCVRACASGWCLTWQNLLAIFTVYLSSRSSAVKRTAECVREQGADGGTGLRGQWITGNWRRLHSEERHDRYCSTYIVTEMRWAGQVARMGRREIRTVF
jgi:hypothetical protein